MLFIVTLHFTLYQKVNTTVSQRLSKALWYLFFSEMRTSQEVTSHPSWSQHSCQGYAAPSRWSEQSFSRCLMHQWSDESMRGFCIFAARRTGRPWAATSGSNSALRYTHILLKKYEEKHMKNECEFSKVMARDAPIETFLEKCNVC